MTYRLGLHDPKPGAVKLRLATYLDFKKLPTPPDHFGHANLITDWGMLANDVLGDCAVAGPCHQTMLWTAEAGTAAPFDDSAAVTNYTAISGYNPDDPDTDQGCDLDSVAKYWRQHGMVDAKRAAHPIQAYLDLNPSDLRELFTASWLFQSVCCGFALPESAIEQAQDGQIWDIVQGSAIAGGHCVPCMGRPAAGMGLGVTWGKPQPWTNRWYQEYNNQGFVALSEEMMVKGKSIDGFDDVTLRDDLKEITRL
jgi:hypothetical protein